MKIFTLLLAFTLITGAAFAEVHSPFGKDFKPAYEAFKESLISTSRNRKAEALSSLETFKGEWSSLASKYKEAPGAYASLSDYSETMNKPISVADRAISTVKEGSVLKAHGVIEEVRYIIWDMNARAGIRPLTDLLNDFHEIMELSFEEMDIADDGAEMAEIWHRKGAWMKIHWTYIDSMVKELDIRDCVNFSELVQTGFSEMDESAEKESFDLYDKASVKVKKGFKRIFFSPNVY
ncbi:hypothetical protein [Limisalsivibrio acetivorans]|uniref:hypothetical protein n=1 Tax=Limisalsivibrio acetivorans TaxID=1304888 RepID=UPI0003B56DBE|nr:hypothetical protein [Limisalsivibrio acetivorans]